MADESSDAHPPERDPVFSAIQHPEDGDRHLPQLLGLLDDEDEQRRLGACWAICHVLVANPELVAPVVRRLLDRLASEPSLATELLATYLWNRFPETVDTVVQATAGDRDDYRRPSLGGPSTSHGPLEPDRRNRNVGRTRRLGEDTDPGPRQVYSDDGNGHVRSDLGPAREGAVIENRDDATGNRDGDTEAGTDDDTDTGQDPLAPTSTVGSHEPPELLSLITYESLFDSLSIVAGRQRGRYADVYRTFAVRDGDEVGVGLSLYHRPSTHRTQFATDLADAHERWHSIADHDTVVTLLDWGTDPRPWATTEYFDHTLADRADLSTALARWNAVQLADALASVHENGIVHGGIDPGNVAYYGNVLDDDERQPPMLTNVTLLHVVRRYFDPTERLDPRYAAPEYFDERFGTIDHATDIYHLGAVCYHLFTGEPPFDGDYRTVRRAVLDGERRRPSEHADVPAAVDDIVSKAMATEKLRRYESVTHMAAELRTLGVSDDGT